MWSGMTRGTPVALGARRSSRRPHSNAVSATTWRVMYGEDGALLGGLAGSAQSHRNHRRRCCAAGVPRRGVGMERCRKVAGAGEDGRRRKRGARARRTHAAARVQRENIMAREQKAPRGARTRRAQHATATDGVGQCAVCCPVLVRAGRTVSHRLAAEQRRPEQQREWRQARRSTCGGGWWRTVEKCTKLRRRIGRGGGLGERQLRVALGLAVEGTIGFYGRATAIGRAACEEIENGMTRDGRRGAR